MHFSHNGDPRGEDSTDVGNVALSILTNLCNEAAGNGSFSYDNPNVIYEMSKLCILTAPVCSFSSGYEMINKRMLYCFFANYHCHIRNKLFYA